jgi:putative glycosyltransferase
MKLSIVTTLYESAPYVDEFYARMTVCAKKITEDYEILFVNDGSPDHALALAQALYQKDSHVTVIDLSRNFGHHRAIMTGLSHAQGDFVFLIDVDLEESPELIEEYWAKMCEDKTADVVYGSQAKRKGTLFEKASGWLFYAVRSLLSSENLPRNISCSRLMTRRYVESLVLFRERELHLGLLWHMTGYRQVAVPIKKKHRGQTSYTAGKRVALAINGLTSASSKPLILIFYVGLAIFCATVFVSIILVIKKLVFSQVLSGWTSVMVSVWLLGGLIILFVGIIGIYLSKVFTETKLRPYTIIRQTYAHRSGEVSKSLPKDGGSFKA